MSDTRAVTLDIPPDEFRALGYRLVDRIAEHLRSLPSKPVTAAEPADVVRRALNADRRLPEHGGDPGDAVESGQRAPLRALALQRPSAVFRLHHVERRADRHARRAAGGGCQSQLRVVDAVADGHGNRSADRALDCRADRVSHRRRRPARQRRQHGQLRLPPRGESGKGRMGRAHRRHSPRRSRGW